jgi:hypothetical protein
MMTRDLLFIVSLLLSPFLVQLSGAVELDEIMASVSNITNDVAKQLTQRLGQRGTTALAVVSAYMLMCRGLRYLRRDRKHAQYPYKTRADYSKMTAQHAWEITKYVMSLEFPLMTEKALQFALFRYDCFFHSALRHSLFATSSKANDFDLQSHVFPFHAKLQGLFDVYVHHTVSLFCCRLSNAKSRLALSDLIVEHTASRPSRPSSAQQSSFRRSKMHPADILTLAFSSLSSLGMHRPASAPTRP